MTDDSDPAGSGRPYRFFEAGDEFYFEARGGRLRRLWWRLTHRPGGFAPFDRQEQA